MSRRALRFSALLSELVEELRIKILYRGNERAGPCHLSQVNLARLEVLNIILALDQHRPVRRNNPTPAPELVTILNPHSVDVGEIDSVLHSPTQTETLEKPFSQTRAGRDTYDQLSATERLQSCQLGKIEIIAEDR